MAEGRTIEATEGCIPYSVGAIEGCMGANGV